MLAVSLYRGSDQNHADEKRLSAGRRRSSVDAVRQIWGKG